MIEIGKAARRILAIQAVEFTPAPSNPWAAKAPGNVSACGIRSSAAARKPVARTVKARDLKTDAWAYKSVAVISSPTSMIESMTGMNEGTSASWIARSGRITRSRVNRRPTTTRLKRISPRSGGVSNSPRCSCTTRPPKWFRQASVLLETWPASVPVSQYRLEGFASGASDPFRPSRTLLRIHLCREIRNRRRDAVKQENRCGVRPARLVAPQCCAPTGMSVRSPLNQLRNIP